MGINIGKKIANNILTTFEPQKVLYDFDGPRIFTLNSALGGLLLAYQCREESAHSHSCFILVPIDSDSINELERGNITVRDALSQPWIWLVEIDSNWKIMEVASASLKEVPTSILPKPGIMLLPDLQPLISLRSVGATIKKGAVTGSTIKNLISNCEKALKPLLEVAFPELETAGRPFQKLRQLYDLVPQYMAYNSFEIGFRLPDLSGDQGQLIPHDEIKEKFEKVGEMLRTGIVWVGSTDAELPTSSNSAHGQVSEVHIAGRLIGASLRPTILKRDVRRRIKPLIEKLKRPGEQTMFFKGIISEADMKFFTFKLREIPENPEMQCSFGDDLVEDVLSGLVDGYKVQVAGKFLKPNTFTVSLIEKIEAVPEALEPPELA